MDQNQKKMSAAAEAVKYVKENAILGVGTGSTVNYFIDGLEPIKDKIKGAVSSSVASTKKLEAMGIKVFDLNDVDSFDIYVECPAELFSDKVSEMQTLEKNLNTAMRSMLGIGPKIHLVAPKTIERSEGKAVRVIDKRKLHW